MFMGEKFGRDSIWESHLASELWLTDVDVNAVLDEQMMTLQDVLDFKVGTRLMPQCLAGDGDRAALAVRCRCSAAGWAVVATTSPSPSIAC